MAYKSVGPIYKAESKRMSRYWDLVLKNESRINDYLKEVNKLLASYGGYSEVVEKTVKYYIEKSGEWKLAGDDKYAKDAQKIADKSYNFV